MAQTTTASLKSKATATARVVSVSLQIAWGRKGSEWPTDWATQSTDETTRLRSVSWDRRLDLDAGTAGRGMGTVAQLRFELENSAQRFSPLNSSGALYSSISAATATPGGETVRYPTMWSTPVRLRMGFWDAVNGHECVTVFSGVIDAVAENYGLAGDMVELTCLDRGALLLKLKASSVIQDTVRTDEWIRLIVSSYGGIATGATFDRGMHIIPYAWLDDENLWSEAQLAAGAEGGAFLFDETGAALFRNAAWWMRHADSITSVVSLTVASLQNMNPGYDYQRMTTGALVQFQNRMPGGEQVIWRRDGIVVPTSGEVIDARFQYPASMVLSPSKPGDWFPVSSGGADLSGKVELNVQPTYAQRATLTFVNNSGQTAFIPKMQLRGLVLTGGPQEEIERNVTVPLVPTNQAVISGNQYIQTKAQAELLATIAAYRNSYPRLSYAINGAPALPWLQLGDNVSINVTEPLSAARQAIVTALAFSWQPDQPFLMNLTAVDLAALFEYDNYHVIGTDVYGEGRAFV